MSLFYMKKNIFRKSNKKKKTKIRKTKRHLKKTRKSKQTKRLFLIIGGNGNNNFNLETQPFLQGQSLSYVSPGINTTSDKIDPLKEDLQIEIEEEESPLLYFEEAIDEYQSFSYSISGFLRENIVDYYSNKSISDLFRTCGEDIPRNEKQIQAQILKCIKQNMTQTTQVIHTLDFIFENALCPTFQTKTVLFRGTDHPYEKDDITKTGQPAVLMKSYVSTTKTLENLFAMYNKGDKILSKKDRCCVNALIVDEGVPYLDLEIAGNPWAYQQEVLLPRGLELVLLGEDKYTFESVDYTMYFYRVRLHGTPYHAPDLDLSFGTLVDPQKMLSLLTVQKQLISELPDHIQIEQTGISKKIMDKMEQIEWQLDTYSTNVIKYVCRKERYVSICNYLLHELQEINALVLENHLQKPDYESSYRHIVDAISE